MGMILSWRIEILLVKQISILAITTKSEQVEYQAEELQIS